MNYVAEGSLLSGFVSQGCLAVWHMQGGEETWMEKAKNKAMDPGVEQPTPQGLWDARGERSLVSCSVVTLGLKGYRLLESSCAG